LEHILYHPTKIYVPIIEAPLRDLLNEVSQMVIVDGVAIEEQLKNSGSPLLRFLDEVVWSIVRTCSARKDTTTNGEYGHISRATARRSTEQNLTK
jgi:hypothetical protein